MNFRVFHRTWWKLNKNWPNGLEPSIGKKTLIGYAVDEEEARLMAKEWNKTHPPGPLSRKAEYEST